MYIYGILKNASFVPFIYNFKALLSTLIKDITVVLRFN